MGFLCLRCKIFYLDHPGSSQTLSSSHLRLCSLLLPLPRCGPNCSLQQGTLLSLEPPKHPPPLPLLVLDFPLCMDHRKACSAVACFGTEQHSFSIEITSTSSLSLWWKSREGEKGHEKEWILIEFEKERLSWGRREHSVAQFGRHFLRVSRKVLFSPELELGFFTVFVHVVCTPPAWIVVIPRQTVPMVINYWRCRAGLNVPYPHVLCCLV